MTTELGTTPNTSAPEQPRPAVARTARRAKRRWPLVTLGVAMTATVVYLVSAYLPPNPATSRVPGATGVHYWLLVAHIFTAAVAGIAGAVQFFPVLRGKHPRLHRWVGRVYFFGGVFPSSLLALPVAVLAPMGASNQVGLVVMDLMWGLSAIAGYRAVRQRRFADHRRWMIRNYALTVASPVTRLATFVMVGVAVPQAGTTYRGDDLALGADIASGSIWLGLLVTVLVAEFYLQRRYGVPSAAAIARSRKS
jgi:uncharacterized membrane protein YozB (DUF420 family)